LSIPTIDLVLQAMLASEHGISPASLLLLRPTPPRVSRDTFRFFLKRPSHSRPRVAFRSHLQLPAHDRDRSRSPDDRVLFRRLYLKPSSGCSAGSRPLARNGHRGRISGLAHCGPTDCVVEERIPKPVPLKSGMLSFWTLRVALIRIKFPTEVCIGAARTKEQSQRRVYSLILRMVFNDRHVYKDRHARISSWPEGLSPLKGRIHLRRLVSRPN
jgi:hypothetical protein